jgi:hypothetical protein
MRVGGGMHFRQMHFFRLGHSLQQQHHCPPHRRHIYGFVGCVQDQHWFLHQRPASRWEGSKMSATSVPRSVGHMCAAHFGDISPPGIGRLWSSGAHRAFSTCSNLLPAGRAGLTALKIVTARTDFASASRSTCVHASSVAPVAITSSSRKIRELSTRPPFSMAKAPRTASQRSSCRNKCFSGLGLARFSNTGRYGT